MRNIKILQVMPEFGLAGAEIMCENLCSQIHKTPGFSVIVVSLYNFRSPITDRLKKLGIKIIFLDKQKGLDFSIIWKLKRIMQEEQIDIVHTHLYMMQYAIPSAMLANVKNRVHTIHNIANKEVGWLARKFALIFYKFLNVVPVSISPLIRESVSIEYKLPLKKIKMIYNGINLEKCQIKSNYKINKTFNIIHIGRFNPQKNHIMILKALTQFKHLGYKFHVNFIGDGALLNECKKEVSLMGLKDNVSFLGLQENVYPYLNDADCFILPSNYEGMPISLIEAMGTGLPTIVTAVGGIPDMVENEVSSIIIDNSSDELVNALIKIYTDEKLRNRLGVHAKSKSREFSIENMTAGYIKIYETLFRKQFNTEL